MTEHQCIHHDDPAALALWKSDRPARFTVRCQGRDSGRKRGTRADRGRHLLAKVFEDADGERLLVVPPWTFRLQAMEGGDRKHGNAMGHGHAYMSKLTRGEEDWQGCGCGIFLVSDDRILDDLARGLKEHAGQRGS